MEHVKTKMVKYILSGVLLFAVLLPGTVFADPYFLVDSMEEW